MAAKRLKDVAVETVVKLNEGGKSVNYIVAHQGSPSNLYYGFENVTWLLRQDIHSNRNWDNGENAYGSSDLNSWLNGDYLNLFDANIRAHIKTVRIPYAARSNGENVQTGANGLSCKAFILSYQEVDGSGTLGTQLSYFVGNDYSKRVAKLNGVKKAWWTRTADETGSGRTDYAYYIDTSGNVIRGYSWSEYGIRPVLPMSNDLFVLDDGTVTDNQPPTAPGSITADNVIGNQQATITLTAATDPDGSVASYTYERQVDGGSWTVFATTSALTRTDPIDDSWTTVAYRAKATDNLGLSGPYATSQTYTVVHNLPPTAPGSIAVSGVVRGETAAITLTAATDPDGTVASYIFERQVDGGAWQQVAQANSLTQTDIIGEDWGTVAYRACAVDDLGLAGPYVTGETYTVNSGWVTIGGPAEDMGSQPRRFDFAFSVSVSGVASVDAITVSVARDGAQIYSGTPGAGEQISVPIDARLLGAGEHVIEVQASKDDYLPASRRYTFTVPAATIPDGGYGAISQASDGKTMFYTTLAQRCIGTDGVDIQAQVDALAARVKTLEG